MRVAGLNFTSYKPATTTAHPSGPPKGTRAYTATTQLQKLRASQLARTPATAPRATQLQLPFPGPLVREDGRAPGAYRSGYGRYQRPRGAALASATGNPRTAWSGRAPIASYKLPATQRTSSYNQAATATRSYKLQPGTPSYQLQERTPSYSQLPRGGSATPRTV